MKGQFNWLPGKRGKREREGEWGRDIYAHYLEN